MKKRNVSYEAKKSRNRKIQTSHITWIWKNISYYIFSIYVTMFKRKLFKWRGNKKMFEIYEATAGKERARKNCRVLY